MLNPMKQGVGEQPMKDALKKLYYLRGDVSHIVNILHSADCMLFLLNIVFIKKCSYTISNIILTHIQGLSVLSIL